MISQSLSKKISAGILLVVLAVFVLALGFLFHNSRKMVKREAYGHAELVLDNAAKRIDAFLEEAELATHSIYWMARKNMQPDSLLAYTRRAVELNPNINGCSITTEPDYFPEYGRYFSAYSIRFEEYGRDSIITECERPYEYFDKMWYKSPRIAGKAVWVDPFDDYTEGSLSSPVMIASYCEPLYDDEGHFVGVISTDISLPHLSEAISAEKPYPESYVMMLGRDGHYFVHPEADRVARTTIFDDVDVTRQPALIALGHEMVAGKSGVFDVKANGVNYISFFRPVAQTGWSIALVCTDDDIFTAYNRLTYIVVPLFLVGLLIMFVYCRRTVTRFIAPLELLSRQAQQIADGHFDERMPHTDRDDVVGSLQNNFAVMQEKLDEHLKNLQTVKAASEQRNRELAEASQKAEAAAKEKAVFLQNMSHQIRTPLNIIMGFLQVLRDDFEAIPSEEVENIADTMQKNAISVYRMVNMLVAAAAVSDRHEKTERHDLVNVVKVAHEVVAVFNNRPPRNIPLIIDSDVSDTLTIMTHRDYLMKILNELIYNSKKFTTVGTITLRLRTGARVVRFIVEDTGPGIPEESRDRIFTRFEKLDDFAEGLGLGLSVSRQFARMLGGDLTLDTHYTGGSRFILELPLV
jgi:signal transduction histidine kinase